MPLSRTGATSSQANVGIVCQALQNSGGFERYVRDLIGALHRRAITPRVYARRIDATLPEARLVEPAVLGVRWLPGKLRDAGFALLLQRRLSANRPRLLLTCNRGGAADIAICGGTHPGFLARIGRRPRFSDRIQIALEQRTYERAKRVVAHSALMAEELRRHYALADGKVVVLPPPADTRRFSPVDDARRAALRAALGLPTDRLVFVFSSTSHERKGYALLRDFFASTELPVCLLVVGRPVEAVDERIRYAGYRDDIENVFRAADYTVIASQYEPFGLVGVESVLCGTPLVSAANVGCLDVIDPTARIAFTRDTPGSLADAIGEAVRRAAAGEDARLRTPREALRYDPDVDRHVEALLALGATFGHAVR
ncbi:glycosyltransferase family 4 protein [Chitinasiproducens palmae]|uniref:Glycosyltransferase involved in cell wall bisynthesis n=1 Tax=Chitinasiproducens palmae TaxID=1770053 RepID=A0A1H2PSQ2_9BURK|nr:glycosyltransferase family 4 protein [Chitinasiproducens palmae]SDV50063.1 Glycosyltransferase involved in cell wall bisynthesis [Chitinasiproducens palmae]